MSLGKYLLLSAVTLSILHLVYVVLIKNKSTIGLRRKTLIAILALSVSLPLVVTGLIQIPLPNVWASDKPINIEYTLSEQEVLSEEAFFLDAPISNEFVSPDVPQEMKENSVVSSSSFLDIQYLFLWIYGIGVLLFGIQLLIQFIHFGFVVFKNYTINQDGFCYVLLNQPNIAATFMHYILMSSKWFKSSVFRRKRLKSLQMVILAR
ncbi:MAG: hypothetical protein GY810_01705 [Aureispira sp.]|nr:hypothetical protein [Aureispira sp.]